MENDYLLSKYTTLACRHIFIDGNATYSLSGDIHTNNEQGAIVAKQSKGAFRCANGRYRPIDLCSGKRKSIGLVKKAKFSKAYLVKYRLEE